MPDFGFGEIVTIVVIALLVFGPDRLPKMAADAGRMLRQVRQMAANARADLVDAAGLENDPELSQTMRDLRDLDPRRGLSALMSDETTRARPASHSGGLGEGTASARPGPAAGRRTGPGSPAGSATASQITPGSSTPGSSTPGSSTPGSSTPGSSTPGSSTPGSSTPGSSAANPSTAGSAAAASASADSTAAGSARDRDRPGTVGAGKSVASASKGAVPVAPPVVAPVPLVDPDWT
ncbi:MAG: twin-arginine translocase TatA/TatE family subunit [Candidatus Nanopelagicales bacterium]